MKKFIIIYLERRENMLTFIQYFNKYRVWHATLFHIILAPCVFEFDTPALDQLQLHTSHYTDSFFNKTIQYFRSSNWLWSTWVQSWFQLVVVYMGTILVPTGCVLHGFNLGSNWLWSTWVQSWFLLFNRSIQ